MKPSHNNMSKRTGKVTTPTSSSIVCGQVASPSSRGNISTGQSPLLRDRVSFFEQLNKSSEDLVDLDVRRCSSRTSNSSFEESYEKLVEEGEYNGAKVVKFEKITVKKSLKEVSASIVRFALVDLFF